MTDHVLPPPRINLPGSGPGSTSVPDVAGIDPEDPTVVPSVLAGLLTSARRTYRAMRVNSFYPAVTAVAAMEDTVATLARITDDLQLYARDCSDQGGKAVARAGDLLGQARSVLSDARHHLALDDTDETDPTHPNAAAVTG